MGNPDGPLYFIAGLTIGASFGASAVILWFRRVLKQVENIMDDGGREVIG